MKRSTSQFLMSTVMLPLLCCGAAYGQTIQDTLSTAYIQNTQLEGQRAQLRATDEQVPQALSNWRPSVQISGSVSGVHTYYSPGRLNRPANAFGGGGLGGTGFQSSNTVGIQISQPLYRGGRTVAQTSQATNNVKSGQAQLEATEQSVLLSAAQSYLDVVRDQLTVEFNVANESVLKRQFEAETDRFRVGEVTRTDVALSESSYEQARAQHTSAIGTLNTDRAAFQRVVGQAPGKLVQPVFKYQLPGTLEDAVAEAETNNPSVRAAEFLERASRDGVDLAEGARLPTVSLVGQYTRNYPVPSNTVDFSGNKTNDVNHIDNGTVEIQMTMPLYTGGLTSSQVRQAKQTANQYLMAIEDAKRVARQTAIASWQQLTASRANIEALTAQVKAAEIAAEGMRQQALVGTATVLDSLTAEQALFQAQLNLTGAQHDALLNSFQLLNAVGQLTARGLALNVPIYDPQENQDRVADKWFGTGIQ